MSSTTADQAARMFTAASTANMDVIKNLINTNGALIRVADEEGLYPGFTGAPCPNPRRDWEGGESSDEVVISGCAALMVNELRRVMGLVKTISKNAACCMSWWLRLNKLILNFV
jgi:hypothetical protein